MRIKALFKKLLLPLLLVSLFTHAAVAQQQRQIAITIDDLPFVGESKNFHLNMIIDAAKSSEAPLTGFVIAGTINPENWDVLRKFHDAGLGLGNHTLSHTNLNSVNTQAYIHEIEEADRILSPVLSEPKYFRYPYLAMGQGAKKDMVLNYLSSKSYLVAPVTVDSKDFVFNQLLLTVQEKERRSFLNVLKACYLDFIWQQTLQAEERNHQAHKPEQSQILLIHSNLLNAYVLPDIINLYRQNGYTIVSLDEALKTINKPSKTLAKKSGLKNKLHLDNFLAWD